MSKTNCDASRIKPSNCQPSGDLPRFQFASVALAAMAVTCLTWLAPTFAAAQNVFSAQGNAAAHWGGEEQSNDFFGFYGGGTDFRFDVSANINGATSDSYSRSMSRYDLQLNGSGFGINAEISTGSGQNMRANAGANSIANGSYVIPSLSDHPELEGRITQIRSFIPIHGRVALYDGASGETGRVSTTINWIYSLDENLTQYYSDLGRLEFDSVSSAAPVVTQRVGGFTNAVDLNLTQFNGDFNPLTGANNLQGWDIDGLVVTTANVDLVEGDILEAKFLLNGGITNFGNSFNNQDLAYAKIDFFNSAEYEIQALDSNGNVVQGFTFQPTSVPEPRFFGLLGIAGLGVTFIRHRRRIGSH